MKSREQKLNNTKKQTRMNSQVFKLRLKNHNEKQENIKEDVNNEQLKDKIQIDNSNRRKNVHVLNMKDKGKENSKSFNSNILNNNLGHLKNNHKGIELMNATKIRLSFDTIKHCKSSDLKRSADDTKYNTMQSSNLNVVRSSIIDSKNIPPKQQVLRCLSNERNKHKYEKLSRKKSNGQFDESIKSEIMSNICSLQQKFDELIRQNPSNKSSAIKKDNKILYSGSTNYHKRQEYPSSFEYNQQSIPQLRNIVNQANQILEAVDWTNRSQNNRSLVIMNKYAPKSTINLRDGKYNKHKNQQNHRNSMSRYNTPSSHRQSSEINNSQHNIGERLSKSSALDGRDKYGILDELQVIAIGHSASKNLSIMNTSSCQRKDHFNKKRQSMKFKGKGINVISAHKIPGNVHQSNVHRRLTIYP